MHATIRRFWMGLAIALAIMLSGAALAGPDGFCTVGQDWPGWDPEWIEPGTITGGGQTFFALVDPGDGCSCPIGFRLTTAQVYLAIDPEMPIPATITVSMGLSEAVSESDGSPNWLPGATICETPVRDFTMFIPKDYVGFGIALGCDCLTMDAPYFLFYTIHSVMGPPGGFYTTGSGAPEPGHFLTFDDSGWVDLAAAGILTRGDLVLSGAAQCCETPVAADARNWGDIKAMFR